MALFATYKYKNISRIEIFTPGNTKLGEISTEKYKVVIKKGKPEKHVFIGKFKIPKNTSNGWYRSVVTMKNGDQYEAKDYVIQARLGIASGIKPEAEAELDKIPKKLS